METIATRLQESGLQLARQHNAFLARTREAGETFVGETREAGRQLVSAVQGEARRWRRFATHRSAQLRGDARAALSLPALERSVLAHVDQTLRQLDSRIRARLAELEKPAKPASKARGRKPAHRARKSRQALPAIAA